MFKRALAGVARLYHAARPPSLPGLRLTPTRLLNYHLVNYQRSHGHTKLRGHPLILTLEATNVCNLHCPHCFTGAGEVGRERSAMPMDVYRRMIDELGDYALMLDFYNWGEPLLNKNLPEMIGLASSKGIATVISTNFSVPFDQARAEALVASGLGVLGAGIDGASQETLVQYRVGAKFSKIMENMNLLVDAKKRLRSTTPEIYWSFHIFEHNRHEIEKARAMAEELGVKFAATKGWVAGEAWDPNDEFQFPSGAPPLPERCKYLWTYAIVNNDGRVAPCSACFYETDDFGSVASSAFKEVWNNKDFQEARRLFGSQESSSHGKSLVCHDCPQTLTWDEYQAHRAQGLPKSSFRSSYTTNDWFNYFFSRRPVRQPASAEDAIPLTPAAGPSWAGDL